MTSIVDKRFSIKDGAVENRKKFIDRYKGAIKDAIKGVVGKSSIKDFNFNGHKIKIKTGEDINLPSINYDPNNGIFEGVGVGNKKFKKGDKIAKPENGGQGRGGSNKGGEEDGFEFQLTEDEFSKLFFEDLELPDLIKRRFTGDAYEIQRCGYSNSGGPSSLNVRQTIIRAYARKIALKKKQEKDGDKLIIKGSQVVVKPKKKINFLEDMDLKYNHKDRVDLPSSKAVMFCLMDVSGSMGEREKDLAKRFYILLAMFLRQNYKIVEIVFVRHAEWAEECSEEIFFHGKESGGTVISVGYEQILKIIEARYNPELWNIYIAQATDGDNWEYDNEHMSKLLQEHLLPLVQYFAYVEIATRDVASNLYQFFKKVSDKSKNFAVCIIQDYKEIFEVFRDLFKKEK